MGRSWVPSAQALLAKFRRWDMEGTRVIRGVVPLSSCLSRPLSSHTPLWKEGGGVGDTEGSGGWTVGAGRGGGTHSLHPKLEGSASRGCCPRTLQWGRLRGSQFSARYHNSFLQFISSINGKSCPERCGPLVIGSALPGRTATKYRSRTTCSRIYVCALIKCSQQGHEKGITIPSHRGDTEKLAAQVCMAETWGSGYEPGQLAPSSQLQATSNNDPLHCGQLSL